MSEQAPEGQDLQAVLETMQNALGLMGERLAQEITARTIAEANLNSAARQLQQSQSDEGA